MSDLKPGTKCDIYEHGIKVFTGHINTAKFQRKPDPFIEIQGSDNWKFVKDYFIDESLGTSNGETVAYWIGVLMNACGLSYNITSFEPNTYTVAPGVEFNLRSVEDALNEILSYSFSYAYVGVNGTVQILNGAKNSNISFRSGETTLYDDADPTHIVGGNVMRATHQYADINTRNVIKVWGWNTAGRPGESPYIQATAYGQVELPVPKTVLYSSSMIHDGGTAQSLADRIAQEMGHFDSIKSVECLGNPNIRIGYRVSLSIDLESAKLKGTAKVTSIHSAMSKDGYVMQVKMDEFCPRFAAWSMTGSNIYAGLDGNGVYISRDKGVSWSSYNNGLPSGVKVSPRIGADPYGDAVAIVNSGLWYEANDLWTQQTLPTPQFGGSHGALKAVGAVGGLNDFAVLTAGGNGSFVYFSQSDTTSSGVTEATISGWSSTKMYYDADLFPISGLNMSGITYDITAHDMYTKTGTAYVLASVVGGSGISPTIPTSWVTTSSGGAGVIGVSVAGYHLGADTPGYTGTFTQTDIRNMTFSATNGSGSNNGHMEVDILLKFQNTLRTKFGKNRFKLWGHVEVTSQYTLETPGTQVNGYYDNYIELTKAVTTNDYYGVGVGSVTTHNINYGTSSEAGNMPITTPHQLFKDTSTDFDPTHPMIPRVTTPPYIQTGSWQYENLFFDIGYMALKVGLSPAVGSSATAKVIIDGFRLEYADGSFTEFAWSDSAGVYVITTVGSTGYSPGTPTIEHIGTRLWWGLSDPVPPAHMSSIISADATTIITEIARNVYQDSAFKVTVTGSTYPIGTDMRTTIKGSVKWHKLYSPAGSAQEYSAGYTNTVSGIDYYGPATGSLTPDALTTSRLPGNDSISADFPDITYPFELQSQKPLFLYAGFVDDFHPVMYADVGVGGAWISPVPPYNLNPEARIELVVESFKIEYYDGGSAEIALFPTSGIIGGSFHGLFEVFDGTCLLLTDIPTYSGSTTDRLYVSDDYNFYIYNHALTLLAYSGEGNFRSIYPTGGFSKVPAIVRAGSQTPAGSGFKTIIGAVAGINTTGKYQSTPETSGGWTATQTIPSGFEASDAVWSYYATKGALMGGKGNGTKVYRFDPSAPPFTVVASDTGIPSGLASNVLDLEYGE
jgi:hypothetical protein